VYDSMPPSSGSKAAAPQGFFDAFFAWILVDTEHTREHAFYIAVHDGGAGADREGGNRGGGRAADAGQVGQQCRVAGKDATVFVGHPFGAGVQVAGTGVVTQAGPVRHDVFGRRLGQRDDVGKAFQEARVVTEHGGHLGLLEHDLRQPDAVGVRRVLPRQRVAAVHLLPGDDGLRKGRVGQVGEFGESFHARILCGLGQ
jgi:hypothetical protein